MNIADCLLSVLLIASHSISLVACIVVCSVVSKRLKQIISVAGIHLIHTARDRLTLHKIFWVQLHLFSRQLLGNLVQSLCHLTHIGTADELLSLNHCRRISDTLYPGHHAAELLLVAYLIL